jgi:DNA-binding beta-propeller fold protein YncE
VAVDHSGNLYVVDQGNSRVQVFSPRGRLLGLWRIANASAGSTGSASNEPHLYGIAVDGRGSVYVTDSGNDRVLELSSGGRVRAEWGSPGSKLGQLRAPQGIAVDGRIGRVYIADTGNNRVQVFSLTGGVMGASPAQLLRPADVAIDGRGILYVADSGNQRITEYLQ